jgi:phosphoribosylaminoimidazole carboxylase
MLVEAASPLGLNACVLDPNGEDSSAGQVAHVAVKGDFKSAQEILSFVEKVNPDVLTVEIEHVNVDALVTVQKTKNISIQPSPETIRIIQDKYNQKLHLRFCHFSLVAFLMETSWLSVSASMGSPLGPSRAPATRRRLLPLDRSLGTH